jgi:hypothetical protein
MKKLFFFFLFINSLAFSQTIRFEGIIQDNTKAPLEMANIMAMNQLNNAMDAYAITNDKGKFVLNLKPNTTYTIKLSYLGMKNKEITVTTENQNITQNITMESGGIELEGVEIVREMPVSIKGDTIVYNADSFKNGTERKLEDVLKKLPGVEVNADGEVEVEGKKVTKLMVEGKDFFDGDTKLGVKNIPADAIDKVQVLRNFNENSILKGVENNQDNLAMNIKLKDGKKNFWFGDVTAGSGFDDKKLNRHIVNPKLFYYSPKYSVNIITNFNDIGELPLTFQDYLKFSGGFRNLMAKGGGSFNVASNDLGFSLLRNNRAKDIETKFGATNFSYNPSKAWNISGFAIVNSSLTDTETITRNRILNPETNEVVTTENRIENNQQESNFGLFKLSTSYKPNSKFQLDYDNLTRISDVTENSFLFRDVIENNLSSPENIFTDKSQRPVSINQNFALYYTPTEKHVWAFETQYLYQDEDPFYNANLGRNPFPDTTNPTFSENNIGIINQGSNRYDLNQSRFFKTNKIESRLDYYYVLTSKSNINVTLGNTYSYQNFDSNLFQNLSDGSVNNLNPNTKNDASYLFNNAYIGLHYKLLTGKFTITPGLSFNNFSLNNTQKNSDYKLNFNRVLPDLVIIYQLKKAETLTYNFNIRNNFTDINQLVENFVMNSYSNLRSGDRTITNSFSQVHSLTYFKYNMFNFENISANASYTRNTDAVKTIALFNGVNQISTPFNSPFLDQTLSGRGSYGRSFFKYYKASLSANLNWSKFYNILVNRVTRENEPFSQETFSQNYTLRASTNFKKIPNIELGFGYSINQYPDQTFINEQPTVKIDYYFLNCLSFVTEYEFNNYFNRDRSIQNEYDFLSASLIYQKKESKWEYKISGTNLLNTTSLNDDNFSQFSTRNNQFIVQPRYVMFSLKYNL